jgi:hypothetical protein
LFDRSHGGNAIPIAVAIRRALIWSVPENQDDQLNKNKPIKKIGRQNHAGQNFEIVSPVDLSRFGQFHVPRQ